VPSSRRRPGAALVISLLALLVAVGVPAEGAVLTGPACRTIAVTRALGPHDQVDLQLSATYHVAAILRLGLVTATFTQS